MHKRYLAALLMTMPAALLTGCGGNGGGSSSGGRAVFTIQWPRNARPAAQSLSIVLMDGNTVVTKQTLVRPANGASGAISFSYLPYKTLTAVAAAYPEADGQGTALASADVSVTVTAGTPATASLTMASTIDRLVVDYSKVTLLVGAQAAVAVTAYDVSNNIVLLTPSALTWTSDDTAKVTVAAGATGASPASATITGIGPGLAHVTVTDADSSVSKQFVVTGMSFTLGPAGDQTISVQGTQTFTAAVIGPTDTSMTWSVVKSDGSVATDGGTVDSSGHYTAPSVVGAGGFYYVQAVSNYDPTQVRRVKITIVSGGADIGMH